MVPGPQGLGSQGSGFKTHFWFSQIYSLLAQSGSTTHSGLHPVMVSGLGISPGSHLQMGFPLGPTVQMAPGPQGLGSQGSGLGIHLVFANVTPLAIRINDTFRT